MKTAIIMASVASMISLPALAEEESYPKLSGELSIEVQNDWTYQSDDPAAEINDLYPTLTLGNRLEFNENFSLNSEATFEPVKDPTGDRAFEDLGGYLNILTANFAKDNYEVYAGKFTPNFGLAWDVAPGLYGTDLNEDYEFAEMIGVGGSVGFHAAGEHTISASTFFQDTTFLSNSVGTQRGVLHRSDGGPANTESLSSYAVALDGGFDGVAGFNYHAGFSSLAEGEDGNKHQLGYVVSAEYAFQVNDQVTITPFAEYAYFDNAGGIDGDSAKYLTVATSVNYMNWVASTTYQRRDTETGGVDTDDHVWDLTLGYDFDCGLGVAAAWRLAEEGGVDSKGLGMLVSYAIEF
ncbi:MAG: hypothetical protein EP348_09980 [Alphaproteobacteria bacterium]|nr:MAG: hypothetical protein EP348_09980 [Alphaproteobacteria bacterium]